MKLQIKKASTDVTVYVFIQDSSSTTGAGLTGLAFNSANLVCYYVRPLGNATQLTLATQTVTGAHSDGGFVEVSSANMPGVYRLDLSDAILATGVNSVAVMLKGAANMAPVVMEIELVAYDPQDANSLGLSVIPTVTNVTNGVTVSTNNDKTGYRLSSTGVDDVLDEVVEGAYTVRHYLRLVAAALAGKLSGAATATITIRDIGDSKNRITATVDSDGNRTAVTLDAT